jgi:hypothetical protein
MVLGDRGGRDGDDAERGGMTLPVVLVAAVVPAPPRLSDAAAAERVAS